jgi:hypothetical protein
MSNQNKTKLNNNKVTSKNETEEAGSATFWLFSKDF